MLRNFCDWGVGVVSGSSYTQLLNIYSFIAAVETFYGKDGENFIALMGNLL